MPDILLGSDLAYEITAPTTLLLNIAVASTDHQHVLEESMEFSAPVEVHALDVGLARNRFHRASPTTPSPNSAICRRTSSA